MTRKIPSMKGEFSKTEMVLATMGMPANCRYCLLMEAPIRLPIPAAGIRAMDLKQVICFLILKLFPIGGGILTMWGGRCQEECGHPEGTARGEFGRLPELLPCAWLSRSVGGRRRRSSLR